METEKKSWFDSSVEKAIDCLGKKINIREIIRKNR